MLSCLPGCSRGSSMSTCRFVEWPLHQGAGVLLGEGAGSEKRVPGLMVFCSSASQSYKSARDLLGEGNLARLPSWAPSHCGTGSYILNKPVKGKQHVSSLRWKTSQRKVCLPYFGNCSRKGICEGKQQKNKCFGAGRIQLTPPSAWRVRPC